MTIDNNTKVSLIIPVYNGEAFVRETLENVICQTYKNMEIIWVDDASTDNTVNIIEEYAHKDDRIKIIKCVQNQGQGAAKNIGIREAEGDIYCFMDSDDIMKEDIIEKCVKMMQENDADVVCFGYSSGYFDSSYKFYIYDEPFSKSGIDAASAMMRKEGIDSNSWGKIYKKNLFEGLEYGGGSHENISVTWRTLVKSRKVYFSGILGYGHLIREGQITSSDYKEKDWTYVSGTQQLIEDVKKEYPNLIESAKQMHAEAIRVIFSEVQCGGIIDKERYNYLAQSYDENFSSYIKTAVSFKDRIAMFLIRFRLYGVIVKLRTIINRIF